GNPVQKQAQAKTNPKASTASGGRASAGGGGSGGKATSKPGGNTGASTRSNAGSSGGGDKPADSCPLNNSFTPGTRVLMADGTTTPIEQVKPGDTVIATDPETGTTSV
ncbi:hypothetical protein, partial [Micromonospora sp. LOL_021]|uniref:hypothetical protein n=1 Tax=Micromonospora sp. LOL_021 TaxID=3345417 RepID=UPI003A88D1E2